MNEIYIVIIVFCLILLLLFFIIRSRRIKSLKEKQRKYEENLIQISKEKRKEKYFQEKNLLDQENDNFSFSISKDIEKNFENEIITPKVKDSFLSQYEDIYNEIHVLIRRLYSFKIEPSNILLTFLHDYRNIDKIIEKHNEQITSQLLDKHKHFFDTCLTYPLDTQQRKAIISEAENCLVVASAGSGKTSSVVGKVKYLTEIKKIPPLRILLISYTHKAATELSERINTQNLKGYTFHKLALDIISKVTGCKPSICEKTDTLFVQSYRKLIENKDFKHYVLKYFTSYQYEEPAWLSIKNDKRSELSSLKSNEIKALLPDMDNNEIYVKSIQEQQICYALSCLGMQFRYEEPYEYSVANEMYSQYLPDFSIYYERNGKQYRVYLEHFALNELGLVPSWFAKEKEISYEEANQKYGDGITWKKATHEKYKTKLIYTTSADFNTYTDIKEKLKELFIQNNIPFKEKSEEELFDMIVPKKSKQEKFFIRLVSTFVTLLKSSCKSIDKIIQETKENKDKRNKDMIKHIIIPMYEEYTQELKNRNQIDFTDAILSATEICKREYIGNYDYIIVDEFQDISLDRYYFLMALRQGTTPAKIYCVGDDWQSIYRFSGSDMSLFNDFQSYFGYSEIKKIETTYRFGNPLVEQSSRFIQKNSAQIRKNIRTFTDKKTEISFVEYERKEFCKKIIELVNAIPMDKSIFLLGRYSFDDYYLSFMFQGVKESDKYYYIINNRKIEFLSVHKSKGLESDYVILLQCNDDTYGFPSKISDDSILNYVLCKADEFPYSEERRLFYVAITRAKEKTLVMYDKRFPSVFVKEFINPESVDMNSYSKHINANKTWTKKADELLLTLHREGKTIRQISKKMGRSQTSIVMRLGKLEQDN